MSDARRDVHVGPGRGRMGGMQPFGFNSDDQGAAKVGDTLLRMFRYMSDMRWILILVVGLAAISAIAQAAAPLYMAAAVDHLQAYLGGAMARAAAASELAVAMTLVLVLFLIGWLTNAGSRYALAAVGQRMLLRMRSQIMSKVHQLSLSYFDRNEAGDLLSPPGQRHRCDQPSGRYGAIAAGVQLFAAVRHPGRHVVAQLAAGAGELCTAAPDVP